MIPYQKLFSRAVVACSGIVALLIVADLIWPRANLFLNGFCKAFLLAACLLGAAYSAVLIAQLRRNTRRPRYGRRR